MRRAGEESTERVMRGLRKRSPRELLVLHFNYYNGHTCRHSTKTKSDAQLACTSLQMLSRPTSKYWTRDTSCAERKGLVMVGRGMPFHRLILYLCCNTFFSHPKVFATGFKEQFLNIYNYLTISFYLCYTFIS